VDEYVRWAPVDVLRPYLAWYTGYRQRGFPPAVHRGLPSPFLTLIFTLDEPLTMAAHPDPRQIPGIFGTLLGGLHTEPALIRHDGAQSGIQVALRPLGARALLGLPAGELAHIDVTADSVLGTVAARIHARVRAAASWQSRFAVLDDEFSRILEPASLVAPEVALAWRLLLLLRSRGTVPVSLRPASSASTTPSTGCSGDPGSGVPASGVPVRVGWLALLRIAGTLTRHIWPVISVRWLVARPASGVRKSSETSKPATRSPGKTRSYDCN
jgi:hypothetical protein